ncbi:LOW QUALITY PROTEIN: hypothetical protein PHMEG_00021607 [Phytophthora megakarya]|uniref:Uncharacterized protein n=1 Tax=Phytophthora megakarya TaxID=4795 RepID=A0A225VM43_9STRA|nr:LOW QUALITY PROTEIN: hypothetical protein PHMEG_00021607 [Phytophthora megakarya]
MHYRQDSSTTKSPDDTILSQHFTPKIFRFQILYSYPRMVNRQHHSTKLSAEVCQHSYLAEICPETVSLWRNESPSNPRPNKALAPSGRIFFSMDITKKLSFWRLPLMVFLMRSDHPGRRTNSRSKTTKVHKGFPRLYFKVLAKDRQLSFRLCTEKGLDPAVEARFIHDLSWPDATLSMPVLELSEISQSQLPWQPISPDHVPQPKPSSIWHYRSDGRGRLPITDPSENRSPFWFRVRVLVDLISTAAMTNRFLLRLEIDPDNRLVLAETALKLSMMAVLGPYSINDKKFSSWSSKLDALGLTWDTKHKSVSMPPDKIAKALARITQALTNPQLRKHQLENVLGSLCHVGMCCRASRAFIQRLHQTWRRASKFTIITLGTSVRDNLNWIQAIRQRGGLNHHHSRTIGIAINLFMDASNSGLCVLHPAAREYIRVPFDKDEIAAISALNLQPQDTFSINVKETLSAVFAVINAKPRCWIDNTTAVSWINRHFSSNAYDQELMQVLSYAEMEFNLHVSTAHLQGSSNFLADMGSRA